MGKLVTVRTQEAPSSRAMPTVVVGVRVVVGIVIVVVVVQTNLANFIYKVKF